MFLIYYTSKLSNKFNPVMSAPNEKLADEWIENNKEKYPKLLKKKIGYYWGKPKW